MSLDLDGRPMWRFSCRQARYAILSDSIVATVETNDGPVFLELEPETGAVLWSAPCEHYLDKVLASERIFLSSTTLQQGPGVFVTVVGAVSFEGRLEEVWRKQALWEEGQWPPESYDWDVVTDGRAAYVGRGSELVGLNLRTGAEEWVAALKPLGGAHTTPGKWMPMVSHERVVVSLPGGVPARARLGSLSLAGVVI